MLARKCDRCGRLYEPDSRKIRKYFVNGIATVDNTYTGFAIREEIDLCPDCLESFEAWLEGGEKS